MREAGRRIGGEGRAVRARIEGVVPSSTGNLYMINALVANPRGSILPGSTATLSLPAGTHAGVLVPSSAITRQGDLTGVTVRTAASDETRWVKLGRTIGASVEVSAGLHAGDQVVVPLSRERAVPADE